MKCNHICPSTCHSAVLTKIIQNVYSRLFKFDCLLIIIYIFSFKKEKREGPWVPIIVKEEYVNQNCPDCIEPILMSCYGNHEVLKKFFLT